MWRIRYFANIYNFSLEYIICDISSGWFLENFAQLLCRMPNFIGIFGLIEPQIFMKICHFLTLNFHTWKKQSKVGRTAQELSVIFKKLTPVFLSQSKLLLLFKITLRMESQSLFRLTYCAHTLLLNLLFANQIMWLNCPAKVASIF